MKALAQQLFDRADSRAWLKYQSNAQESDTATQARYYRAAVLLLQDKPREAIHNGLVIARGETTDWEWALQMQQRIFNLILEGVFPEDDDGSEQADWEESQADNWARHPRREQRDRTD
jgi:hypothetical protein